ncbi:MAG TPA: MlaD family protein [Candidatus Cloacimonadota bacterium]|jgi:phospholipid/cholesterol/gamma-HCH transport system substrate-binding protein|nr:MlaD family protein [Candidatus Cloacimonadales bacterium]HPY96403.1 MlaD family protein [Candidatus Cloacimonadota bacterium]HQB41024.1 MlaD family protein [Candidatus Cloacimonadota bacterium]
MVSKAQKIRLGVFLLAGLFCLLVLVILIAGSKMMEKRDKYYIRYDNTSVSGLQVGGHVMYNGIKIGRIENIQIDKKDVTSVIVDLTVIQGTPIKENTEATLIAVGITGLKQIELTGGTNDAKNIPVGSFIKPGKSLFDNISDKAEVIANKVDAVLTNIIEITNKENQTNLEQTLANLKTISQDIKTPINNSLNNVETLTYELSRTLLKANQILEDINTITQSGKVNKIVDNLEVATNKLSDIDTKKLENEILETGKKLNETVNKANILMNRIDALVQKNSPDINATIENLRETIENLNEFSRQISDDPSMLINFGSRRQNP